MFKCFVTNSFNKVSSSSLRSNTVLLSKLFHCLGAKYLQDFKRSLVVFTFGVAKTLLPLKLYFDLRREIKFRILSGALFIKQLLTVVRMS